MDDPPATPADAPRLHAQGDDFQRQGRPADAVACYRRALSLQPEQVQSLNNLALALQTLGRVDEALHTLRQALALRPEAAQVVTNLGNLLKSTGRVDEAIASYEQSLHCRPADGDTLVNLAATLRDAGRVDEAIACYRRAIAAAPDHAVAHSGLLYTLHFDSGQTRRTLAAEHRLWNDRYARPLATPSTRHPNTPDPGRRLRIGYASPNFASHPVGRFVLPLLAHHDRDRFEIVCFSDTPRPDEMTTRLRTLADAWRVTNGLTDAQFAAAVRTERIDVLVDLNLHMSHGRMLAFARKPAPVQITYLAYASTSGLDAMDARVSDASLDPDPLDPADYTETTLRLPQCYWCYAPATPMPDVSELPASRVGYVTFGHLNQFCKVSESAIAAWTRILRAVPRSRLRLHAHAGRHRQRCAERFARHGVDPSRIEWVGFLPFAEYLMQYCQIDIALDPFPYAGGTTTCDALWMGVPVVSLVGSTAVARSGLSILTHAGLPDLATTSSDNYVTAATRLANDLDGLVALRSGLRRWVEASPLADAVRYTKDMEALYCSAWLRWCTARAAGQSTI